MLLNKGRNEVVSPQNQNNHVVIENPSGQVHIGPVYNINTGVTGVTSTLPGAKVVPGGGGELKVETQAVVAGWLRQEIRARWRSGR